MHELPFEIPQSLRGYLTQFENDPDRGIANLEAFLKKRGMDAVGYFLLSWLYFNNGQKEDAVQCALKAKCFAPGSPFFQHLHYFLVHPDHFEAWKPFAPDAEELVDDGEEVEDAEAATEAAGESADAEEQADVEDDGKPAGTEARTEDPMDAVATEEAAEHAGQPETTDEAADHSGAPPFDVPLEEYEEAAEADTDTSDDPALNLDTLIEQISDAEKKKITISADSDDNRNLSEKSEKVGDIASETLAMIYEKQKKYPDALRTLNKLSKTRPDKADFYREEINRIRVLMSQEEEEGEA